MSVCIYKAKYTQLGGNREIAEWLSDNFQSDTNPDYVYFDKESFEEAVKLQTKKFRKENKEEIETIRKELKALPKDAFGLDLYISW